MKIGLSFTTLSLALLRLTTLIGPKGGWGKAERFQNLLNGYLFTFIYTGVGKCVSSPLKPDHEVLCWSFPGYSTNKR